MAAARFHAVNGCRSVKRILTKDGKACGVELMNGETKFADEIISTMPLTLVTEALPEISLEAKVAARKLQFRNTILVFLKIESENLFPDQWLYIHSKNLQTGRVTNFKNWIPEICQGEKASILALEYWCNFEDALWKTDDAHLIQRARDEIVKTKLVLESHISDGFVHRVPRCYPIYKIGYKEDLKKVTEELKKISGLQLIGRYGSFKYNNQDHSILMGLMAAENLSQQARHDLWSINTDDEYQESSRITATGLEMN